MIKVSGENPLIVTPEVYKSIEDDLEAHWETLPWKNIYTNGKRGAYKDVVDRFHLVIYSDYESKAIVQLVSKEDASVIPFYKTYWLD